MSMARSSFPPISPAQLRLIIEESRTRTMSGDTKAMPPHWVEINSVCLAHIGGLVLDYADELERCYKTPGCSVNRPNDALRRILQAVLPGNAEALRWI